VLVCFGKWELQNFVRWLYWIWDVSVYFMRHVLSGLENYYYYYYYYYYYFGSKLYKPR